MKKKLWMIFGPVIVAIVALLILLWTPIHFKTVTTKKVDQASTSLDVRVLKGESVKNAAEKENYIPIIGSSELSRMDPFHPSSMAQKYHWKNKPFLLGNPGTASLTQTLNVSGMSNLKNQKAVVIISPQWFTKKGVPSDAFKYFLSPLQLTGFIVNSDHGSKKMNEYIASRVLELDDSLGSIETDALTRIADGKNITSFQRFYINDLKRNSLQNQDDLFGTVALNDHQKKIDQAASKLPDNYDYKDLNKLATKMAKNHSRENDLQIGDSFYNKELYKRISTYKNAHRHVDYKHSPEYNDFQAMLYLFNQNHTEVMFVIQPVNQKWIEYTGMPKKALPDFDKKIKYQLQSQGFNNIVDLTHEKDPNYIAEDTIHMGWRGWLLLDKKLEPYYKNKKANPNNTKYEMNDYFLTKKWANNTKF
ncbi:D-alanyl-lipoteichoic acid biosynthesis protein DltD [Companilactobacillus allii]|uniref:Protein DltD n=1 Tax=Companilactobacillus allii TaxID=1847728 RepID=A0A1P8Q0D7_9LACO|nr:D-alanyl-lipoteichoic acid biosynthesis protein DltD [Companilactobacillus allii]APX71287.1 D-alanyl-lipoteichoic acid biosynthesis protein DltD [Companilactobacillus allii]USQ68369.1 D-alanyl-lipoteichoic acid biosynthesis protein DltD [Companilactobacillus allii]